MHNFESYEAPNFMTHCVVEPRVWDQIRIPIFILILRLIQIQIVLKANFG